jgi:hypothetical protein
MASPAIDWDAVKNLIMSELEKSPRRPTELLGILSNKVPDAVVKESVLRMLQDQSIKMTPDQQLCLGTPTV